MLGGLNWLMLSDSDLLLLSMKCQGDKTFVRLVLSRYDDYSAKSGLSKN